MRRSHPHCAPGELSRALAVFAGTSPRQGSPPLRSGRAALRTGAWRRPGRARNAGTSSLQLVGHLLEASLGAGFVLLLAGSAAHTDAADRVLADLDRDT